MAGSTAVLWFDFDQTAFCTFLPPLGGLGVEQACEQAVRDIFGEQGNARYLLQGGLRNRAPAELVRALLPLAQGVYVRKRTEDFIQAKLAYLMAQIGQQPDGSIWPPPCPGFVDFWRSIPDCAQERVYTGVISSGHTAFIERVWKAYGLSPPDVIVSEDDIRPRRQPQSLVRRVKPAVLPLALGRYKLRRLLNCPDVTYLTDKSRQVYFGDDRFKDGGMAARAKMTFGHLAPGNPPEIADWGFRFGDWRWVQDRLEQLVRTGSLQ